MFAVIIPTKTLSNLTACVAAIRENEPALKPEHIIVVDDSDGDEVFGFCAREHYTWLKGEKPFIFSRNTNAGARFAFDGGSHITGVIFCNDDALLKTAGGFTALHKASQACRQFGCIGAVTNLTGQPLQRPKGVGLRPVPHIAYVCVYIPRSTFEGVQWMDERYCIDYGVDDRDHCEAITRAGLMVGVHDGCYMDHGSLVSSFRGDPTTPRSFQQNYALFKAKWGVAE